MKKSNTQLTHRSRLLIRNITVTAVMIALATVSKFFVSFNVPLLGSAKGMQIGIGGIFNFFPAALCGPLYGGAASAISDLIGVLINPSGGAYNPLFTLVAFAGGVIKGLLWMLVSGKRVRTARVAALVLLVCIGLVGVGGYISLASDGIIDGIVATGDKMPSRGEVEGKIASGELSPVSRMIVGLAQYKNDSYTLNKAEVTSGEYRVPAKVDRDGYEGKLTKIADGAFSDISGAKIYIPPTVKTVTANAFKNCTNITVVAVEGSAAAKLVGGGITVVLGEVGETVGEYSDSFTSSGNYAGYLSGYINFVTFGLVLVFVLGLAVLTVDYIAARRKKDDGGFGYIPIVATTLISGLIVSTVNTVVLMLQYYQGQAFFILWLPRTIEEIIVVVVQAYFITLLYNVYVRVIAKTEMKHA